MLEPPAGEADHDERQDRERDQQLSPRGFADRQPGDGQDCHRRLLGSEQREESFLERLAHRLDRIDTRADADQIGDQLRHRVGADAGDDVPAVVLRDRPAPRERGSRDIGDALSRIRTPPVPSSSSRPPVASTRPLETIATRSHTCSTSPSRCEFRNTAQPRSRRRRMMSRVSARPTGSSADVGSSSTPARDRRATRRQSEALLHPFRERLDLRVRVPGEPDGGQRPGDLRRPLRASDLRRAGNGAPSTSRGAQPALVPEQLRADSRSRLRVWRSPAGRPSTHASPPVGPASGRGAA